MVLKQGINAPVSVWASILYTVLKLILAAIFYVLLSNLLRSNENNLIYFRKQLGNKGKRKLSASRALFSCNMLRGNKVTIFLS